MVQTRSHTENDVPASTTAGSAQKSKPRASENEKLQSLMNQYGESPLVAIIDNEWPKSNIVMVYILNALLSSARISHSIALTTLKCLVDENYHDLEVLRRSSWQERTEVLTKGGYTRYREKTATFLGELVDLMENEYNNDAFNILPAKEHGHKAQTTLAERVKAIKGLGPVGCEIFLGTLQGFFPNVAPFLDERNQETAKKMKLGDDVDSLFAAVGSSPDNMARLQEALTRVRLENKAI